VEIYNGNKYRYCNKPINSKRDETLALASECMGSFVPEVGSVYVQVPAYADARIDLTKGVVICSSVD
jgi:hypothetical protein